VERERRLVAVVAVGDQELRIREPLTGVVLDTPEPVAADGEVEAAFLLRPTPIEDVFARAREGRVLPQKTTYFFPKLTSGLLFQPLD